MILLFIAQALSWSSMCSFDPGRMCTYHQMIIKEGPSAFIGPEFKSAQDQAMCQGKLVSGSLRYMINGTAPSSLVGTVVPQIPNQINDPTGTLELEGNVILLTNKKDILGFKATQANWGGAELSWECSL